MTVVFRHPSLQATETDLYYLPVKDCIGNHIGMCLDPSGILENVATGAVLLEVLVGNLSCKDALSEFVIRFEVGHTTDTSNGSTGEGPS